MNDQRDSMNHKTERRTTPLFWLAVLGLGVLSLLMVSWIASWVFTSNGAGNLLRLKLVLPKLNINHGERKAEAFRMSEPVPSELAHPKERATLTPTPLPPALEHPKVTIVEGTQLAFGPPPTHEPPRHEPWLRTISQVEGPPPVETCQEPAIYLDPCARKRGDTPMIRNWKTLTMLSLLSAATIATAPPPLFAGEKDANGDLKKSIDKLILRIGDLEKKPVDEQAIRKAMRAELKTLEDGALTEIKKSIDLANEDIGVVKGEQRKQKRLIDDQKVQIELLSNRLESLERRLATGGGSPVPAVDKTFMEEFRTTMRNLNDTLAKITPTQERISMSSPTNGGAKMSRVMLANHHAEDLLFIINNVGYRLPAYSTKILEPVPPGPLSYEVHSTRHGVLERRSTNLPGGFTFNLAAQ